MERVKVVTPYADGGTLKGFSQDFSPNKDRFHLFPADKPSGAVIEVLMKDLKAIFMVRDLAGDPQYKERKKYAENEKPSGRKVEVTFFDREVLVGSTLGYDPKRQGFFSLSCRPKSNNTRV